MRLLLWKGALVKTRQKFWLTVELLVPLILFVILALVRTRDFTDSETQCHYDSKGFPSAGILPFLHSFLCSFSNKCHLSPTTGDEMRYIHNATVKNESIIVDLLYYSSQQLEWIGENPSEFSQLLDTFTQVIKTLARINGTAVELPRLNQVNELRNQSIILLPFLTFQSVPILCNETKFNNSFILPPNTTLSDEDRRSLCGVSPFDLFMFYSNNQDNIMLDSYPGFQDVNVFEFAQTTTTFISLVQQQPLYEGFLRWSHLLSSSLPNITSALFCGDNPFDTSTDGVGPVPTHAKTPFDEMRRNLIEFMEKIVPGRQKHDKQFCHDVWIHDDLNCSSLESAVMQRIRPIFTGYILVTPPSPAVKRLIDTLNGPLRITDFLRQLLYQYPEIADSLQNALHGSDLRAASLNVLVLLQRFGKQLPVEPQWLKNIEFAMEHVFAPATDPYSFGALTKNFTETFNRYTTCFLLDRFVTVANESVMEETATCLADYQQYFSGIVVLNMKDDATEFGPVTTYKIRHLPSLVDGTYFYEDNPRRVFDRKLPFTDLKYLTYGFSFLQEAVERAIIGLRVNSKPSFGMYSQQEPYPCVAFDKFNIVVFLGLFVILSFICPAALLVKNIVHEKELRLKEQMRIMGLGDMVHLWSWAIISLIINLASTAIISAIIKLIFPQTTLGYGSAMLAIYSDDGKGTWKDINSIYLEASESFDSEPKDLSLTVFIAGMSKIYSNGTKALDNLTLRLYEDQITALLGHNGAGKTTTILTVSEQLKLFAALKGTPDDRIQHDVDDILQSVSLVEKANELASTLSGGMKRRLCIGIALVGGSRFVILDEPTAGVDVTSRREIWSLLQNNKKGRTILLSTHHMDEADILSDRIALLSEGRLITLGSSMFLKNRYGDAFQDHSRDYTAVVTRIVTEATIPIKLSDETENELHPNIDRLTKARGVFYDFRYEERPVLDWRVRNIGTYSTGGISIISCSINQGQLKLIFVSLSPQKEYVVPRHRAGILSKIKKGFRGGVVESDERHLINTTGSSNDTGSNTAVTVTTASGTGLATVSRSSRETPLQNFGDEMVQTPLAGWELTMSHTKAIMKSRFQYTIRSKKHVLFEVILPICLLLGCELYAKIQFGGYVALMVTSQPPLPLIPEMYGNGSFTYVSLWDRNSSSLSYQIMKTFEEPPDMGTRCVKHVPIFRRQLAAGCDPTVGNGTFNWNSNETVIPYNADVNCQCKESLVWNCTAKDYPLDSIPTVTLNTTMRVLDMSYRNISQMRLATRWWANDTMIDVLGGFSLGHTSLRAKTPTQVQTEVQGWHLLISGINKTAAALNVSMTAAGDAPTVVDPFLKNMTVSNFITGVLGSMETQENAKAWFNNKLYTSLPIFTNILSNALLRIESKDTDPSTLGIIAVNHPMNQTVKESFDAEGSSKLIVFRIVLIVLVLCVIPAGFTVFLVEERVCDAFHLQLVSGLSRFTYWFTGYLFDMSIYILSVVAILMIYVMFGVKEFAYSFESLCCFFLVFLLYGLCAVLWAYVLQRRFDVPALSFVMISVGTFFVGIVASLTVIVIEKLMQEDPTLIGPHTVCSTVFLILPQYNLGMAIFRGSFVFQLIQLGENFLSMCDYVDQVENTKSTRKQIVLGELNRPDLASSLPIPSLLQWSLMGMHCACLTAHILIAALVLFILEREPFGFLRKWEQIYTRRLLESSKCNVDEDVIAEQRKVDELEESGDNPLVVKDLAKAYTKKALAVQNVSFAVDQGECFGLLGLNGAGKTTTFAILTQKIRPGYGSVQIHGRSMVIGDRSSFDQVGYCPQFDALNMKLTTTENIQLFARIRGVPERHIESLVSQLLVSLHLKAYASTVTSALSGGNRRKLSVAIALISHPSLILLDEPSAGMDPGSQQFLWRVIDRLRKSGKAVV
ncbi:ABC transporter, ATP-binding protein [Teladorsagia circumcincta]|uniref:ABC transporter, ATP-binding protein n=1 Tax=Teladorsagia circumcincta TaxID=45464 RepID=A0A2G9V2M1_TELCI|nr:ABC transporter, ATP-binding protein [Teladorsagia circumcincta]